MPPVGAALDLARKHWRAIVLLLAAGVLGWMVWDARSDAARAARERDAARVELGGERALHAVTRKSVDALTVLLEHKNRESDARAAALTASRTADAAAIAAADRRYVATRSRVEALEALARSLPANPACRVPAAIADKLKDL